MTIKDMHYDFKTKLNKVDSQQYRNLQVPEIDWKLNEAQELFVKLVARPELGNSLGFETSQRSIDDIRTIVVQDYCSPIINNTLELPDNYWHFLNGRTLMNKGACTDILSDPIKIRTHHEDFMNDEFEKPSFEWREVSALFFEGGLKVFDDGTFTNTQLCMDYIRRTEYMHNAEDFRSGGYRLPSGELLQGFRNSELPEPTCREIVDIAVLIVTGELQIPDYQIKGAKVQMNRS